MNLLFLLTYLFITPLVAAADEEMQMDLKHPTSREDCSGMETFDASMEMCTPLSMTGMPMSMLMLDGNAFATGITETGPKGRTDFALPNSWMVDAGTSIGASHYLNLEYMGTLERITLPYQGYPELLQIGESNTQGSPFINAQHPHSSPIMGLTLSDTYRFEGHSKDHLKIFFAPRGSSTDGPIAFMHRLTGSVNPDAPLGHHIGQDVGHISSTVAGLALDLGHSLVEFSTFSGVEPKPDAVDLPLHVPNSFAVRFSHEFSSTFTAMISGATLKDSEPNAPEVNRYSASLYFHHELTEEWNFHNTLIFGIITHYDHASSLTSFCEEFLMRHKTHSIWGRIEALQRTAAELEIANLANQNQGQWVEAFTAGYTKRIAQWSDSELGLGSSITMDLLPSSFSTAYGSRTPLTAKIFLQFGGMKMWNL